MNIVAEIKNSIGRDDRGEIIDEVLFSVVEHECGDYLSLWVSLPKMVFGKLDLDNKDCLDCCAYHFWEGHCRKDIKEWMKYIGKMVDSEVVELKEEVENAQEQLKHTLCVQDKLREVL